MGFSLSDIEKLIHSFPDGEKAEANELLTELQKTESATHPILVEGALSKFSNLIKKHTDLLIASASLIVSIVALMK